MGTYDQGEKWRLQITGARTHYFFDPDRTVHRALRMEKGCPTAVGDVIFGFFFRVNKYWGDEQRRP